MIGILYSEVNFICIVIMAIIAISVFFSGESKVDKYVLALLTFFCFIMFSADSVWALADNGVIPRTYNLIYTSNFLYFFFSGFVGLGWYYISESLYFSNKDFFHKRWKNLLIHIPAFIIIILTITNVWTGSLFYIDENLNYHRGNLHFIQACCGYFYEFYVVVRGIINYAKIKDNLIKKRIKKAIVFLTVPLLGSAFQAWLGSIPALCVGTTLAELLMYTYITTYEREKFIIEKGEKERGIIEQALSSILYSYREIYFIQFRERSINMIYPTYVSDRFEYNYETISKDRIDSIPEDENNIGEITQFFDLNRARIELMSHDSVECKYSVRIGEEEREWQSATFIIQEKQGSIPVSAFLTIRSIQDLLSKEQDAKKKLEEALAMAESANKAKSVFLNNMSHDIRTPMNAILGFADIAKKEMDDKARLEECLSKIILSGKDLLNLINDILDMSSIESGKVKFNHVATSVRGLAESIRDMFANEAEKKQINFFVNYDEITNDYVYCDELRAKQVVINIVSNAFKYTPMGGTVSLTVRQYPLIKEGFAKYELVVQDNGIGMSKEFKEQIFDSFSRERSATLSGIQGTGLGMAIVKKIIDMVDGEIDVWSEVNVGTKITIRLVIKTAEKEEELKTDEPEENYDFTGKKVLLVEDNELNREIAEAILSEVGIQVESVVNGQEAVNRMADAKPGEFDLVLMDIQMPVMDGYTATTKIRELEDPEVAYIPIVAMTANAFDEDRKETMNMGMNGHISKPIDIDEMLSTMKKCMGL